MPGFMDAPHEAEQQGSHLHGSQGHSSSERLFFWPKGRLFSVLSKRILNKNDCWCRNSLSNIQFHFLNETTKAMCGAGSVSVLLCLYQLQVKEKEPSRFKYVAMFVLLCFSWQGSPKKCEAEEAEPPAATQPQTSETQTSRLPESERSHHTV